VRSSPNWLLLLGSLLVIGALHNHFFGHSVYLVEIVFVAVGGALSLYSLRMILKEPEQTSDGLLFVILTRYTAKETYTVVLPLLGFLIVVLWSAWKLIVAGESDLRLEDFIVTSFGIALILYTSAPSRFTAQKDFVVLYLMFMAVVFVVIWRLYLVATGGANARITAYSQYYLITTPVVALVSMLGVHASAQLVLGGSGLSNFVVYEYHGRSIILGIGATCSGLYSAGLFFSAFLAFVLVRYRKVDRYILLGLGTGLLVTWLSNIFRMVITVLVGSIYGYPALATFHSYFGIVAFIIFLTVFWTLIVRWLDRREPISPASSLASPCT
jgi:exosortase/archaeosortase family protein